MLRACLIIEDEDETVIQIRNGQVVCHREMEADEVREAVKYIIEFVTKFNWKLNESRR